MSIDIAIGTATGVLAPFAQLLTNPTVISIIALIYFLGKFESWGNRKAVLGKYEQELVLEKEKKDLRKKIMAGKWKDDIDFDKIVNHFEKKLGNPTEDFINLIDEEINRFDWRDWK